VAVSLISTMINKTTREREQSLRTGSSFIAVVARFLGSANEAAADEGTSFFAASFATDEDDFAGSE
jgi:hypothetical protein